MLYVKFKKILSNFFIIKKALHQYIFKTEIRSSGEGLDMEAATELEEGEGGIDVLEEADPESCRFQHCPWNGEHVQTCPKLAISQKCGKG